MRLHHLYRRHFIDHINNITMTYQFKIKLEGSSKPPVWRKVLVPDTYSFYELHMMIQAAFGWDNAHLFEFSNGYSGDIRIGVLFEDDWDEGEKDDAEEIGIGELFHQEKQKLQYLYDFGDSWAHLVTLEKITDEKIIQARCIGGKGACPPEDCGGIYGYYMLVDTVNDPQHEEHEDMREWLGMEDGKTWDVNAFSIEEANQRVLRYLQEQSR